MLTPRGEIGYEESFHGITVCDFNVVVNEDDVCWKCTVSRRIASAILHTVSIPKDPTANRSYLGK